MIAIMIDLMPLFAATLLGGLLVSLTSGCVSTEAAVELPPQDNAHVFTFKDGLLIGTSRAARAALSLDELDGEVYDLLLKRMSHIFPNLPDRIAAAISTKTDFTMRELSVDGPISLTVKFDEAGLHLAITGLAAPMARKVLVDQDRVAANEAELETLRNILNATPVPMWREDTNGRIEWVNPAYSRLIEDTSEEHDVASWPPPHLFRRPASTTKDDQDHRRSHLEMGDGRTDWFEITQKPISNGNLHCAIPANATVRAESHLRNFTQTLTQTFAHIPIGLAIFDRRRQLAMFNPALVSMTSLDAPWLAAKPTLFDMLNKMRDSRMVPERKDFNDWRNKLEELEQLAAEGCYSETWALPSGQTYRVTGRPHPEGALAFLFEDISAEITLTREFRRRIELKRSMFDNLPEAIAVFSNSGTLEMCNRAYCDLWDIPPEHAANTTKFIDAVQNWQSACTPTPIWGDLRDFVSQYAERTEWFASVERKEGQELNCHFAPLVGGATLVGFSMTARTRPARSTITQLPALSA